MASNRYTLVYQHPTHEQKHAHRIFEREGFLYVADATGASPASTEDPPTRLVSGVSLMVERWGGHAIVAMARAVVCRNGKPSGPTVCVALAPGPALFLIREHGFKAVLGKTRHCDDLKEVAELLARTQTEKVGA